MSTDAAAAPTAREEVLRRIRAANAAAGAAAAPVPPVPRDYATAGTLSPGSPGVLDLLEDRLADYQARVTRCSAAEVPAAVGAALRSVIGAADTGHERRVVVPAGLPRHWVLHWGTTEADGEVTVVVDDGALSWSELDAMSAVVTAATVAAAVTGTIVLDGSADQGRRAISLVPDVHICVVTAEQVVHSVPEMLDRLDPVRPTTFISGPSATSDIELERVEGVHGPRTLHVVLVC
jgi:L-lactate dehydrogenase complex protein LldG